MAVGSCGDELALRVMAHLLTDESIRFSSFLGALLRHLSEGQSRICMTSFTLEQLLPAPHGHVDIQRIELQEVAAPLGFGCSDQGRAAAAKRVQDDAFGL